MNLVSGDRYIKNLLQGQSRLSASPFEKLNQLRSNAVNQVSELKFPTKNDEEWRFTDISPLTNVSFRPSLAPSALQSYGAENFYLSETGTRLVFIDGAYAPHLSSQIPESSKDSGVMVSNLSTAFPKSQATIESHLGRHVEFHNDVFAALNTAFIHEGAIVIIPRNTSVDLPVHLLFIATQKETSSFPRCLIIAESNSKATIIEDYVTLIDDTYATNSVAEFVLSDNASINHIRIQRESKKAFHIANCSASLAKTSRYKSVSVTFGARISRFNINVLLNDKGAESIVDGLALISDHQLADTHTCIDHIKPHCTSRQLHKCIIDDSAHAIFNGKIIVKPNAQLTNSTQSNHNLLLTSNAKVDTKPQLEIFADDVKCAHGATVGQLDHEEIFYLKSRGLAEITARNLLTYAFGAEIIERIPIKSLRLQLEGAVLEQTQRSAP